MKRQKKAFGLLFIMAVIIALLLFWRKKTKAETTSNNNNNKGNNTSAPKAPPIPSMPEIPPATDGDTIDDSGDYNTPDITDFVAMQNGGGGFQYNMGVIPQNTPQ